MKLRVGDKVIAQEFETSTYGVHFAYPMAKYVGTEQTIEKLQYNDDGSELISYRLSCGWSWDINSVELVESKEYFYVGQEVYSPLFQNKERKGKVLRVELQLGGIIVSDGVMVLNFTLDGKREKSHDYISLFQEPIIFPVNKPIEKPLVFEKGEIVEVSDDGYQWIPVYYKGLSEDKRRQYEVFLSKKNGKLDYKETYAKIRKVNQTS
jgi:hypothetical protein